MYYARSFNLVNLVSSSSGCFLRTCSGGSGRCQRSTLESRKVTSEHKYEHVLHTVCVPLTKVYYIDNLAANVTMTTNGVQAAATSKGCSN